MMNRLGVLTAVGLGLAILAVAIYGWLETADMALDAAAYIPLALGIVATVALGALLVGLMLYSNRHGYDDRAGERFSRRPPPAS